MNSVSHLQAKVVEKLSCRGQVGWRYQASSKIAWWQVLKMLEFRLIYVMF
jgi:hypothetical protein